MRDGRQEDERLPTCPELSYPTSAPTAKSRHSLWGVVKLLCNSNKRQAIVRSGRQIKGKFLTYAVIPRPFRRQGVRLRPRMLWGWDDERKGRNAKAPNYAHLTSSLLPFTCLCCCHLRKDYESFWFIGHGGAESWGCPMCDWGESFCWNAKQLQRVRRKKSRKGWGELVRSWEKATHKIIHIRTMQPLRHALRSRH